MSKFGDFFRITKTVYAGDELSSLVGWRKIPVPSASAVGYVWVSSMPIVGMLHMTLCTSTPHMRLCIFTVSVQFRWCSYPMASRYLVVIPLNTCPLFFLPLSWHLQTPPFQRTSNKGEVDKSETSFHTVEAWRRKLHKKPLSCWLTHGQS